MTVLTQAGHAKTSTCSRTPVVAKSQGPVSWIMPKPIRGHHQQAGVALTQAKTPWTSELRTQTMPGTNARLH
eukprot:2847681-Amphidinium_carterae.1